jgi:hypothetical protein
VSNIPTSVRRRPLVLWLILVYYVATAISTIILFALLRPGVLPLDAQDTALLATISAPDYAVTATASAVVVLGAVLLFALKKAALPVLYISLALSIVLGLWYGFASWRWWVPLIGTIAYAERLRRRGMLT